MTTPRRRSVPSPRADDARTPSGALEDLLEAALDGRGVDPRLAEQIEAADTRPPSVDLLLAGAHVLRRRAVPVETPPNRAVIDLADARGPADGIPDVLGGAALLVAACDGTVARGGGFGAREHLYEALGLPVDLRPRTVTKALAWCGFALLRAATYHPLLAALPTSLRGRRLFDLLLPLANPAQPDRQIIGVSDPALTEPMVRALGRLGSERALVVTAAGSPYLRPDADSTGHLLNAGRVTMFGHPGGGRPLPSGGRPELDAEALLTVYTGHASPLADAVALNAGAALWIGGVLPSFVDGRRWAADRLAQGIDLGPFREIQ